MIKIGMDLPISKYAYNMEEALRDGQKEIGYPLIG